MAQYVIPTDLIARFDERDAQELVLDNNSNAELVDVRTNERIQVALDDAEGEVVAALRRGGRYNSTELAALTGTDLAYLKRIICEITMLHLLRRRPDFRPRMLEAYEKIRESHLKALQNGDSVISASPLDLEAGHVSVDGPTVSEWNRANMWRDRSDYFPKRIERHGRNQ